ncbi:hypothetical protein CVV72_10450 [Amycolatopsis sp. TNS106]|nr:hypothetical protein CVV72_10450 [Amycolatopsis sp. TNS106]
MPGGSLPRFTVNVVPTSRISGEYLGGLLQRYRSGEIKPLIFGDDNVPEAAVIPFEAFVRLMRSDHAAYVGKETEFQGEVTRRVQESDLVRDTAASANGMTLEQLAEGLDEPARSMMLRQLDDE